MAGRRIDGLPACHASLGAGRSKVSSSPPACDVPGTADRYTIEPGGQHGTHLAATQAQGFAEAFAESRTQIDRQSQHASFKVKNRKPHLSKKAPGVFPVDRRPDGGGLTTFRTFSLPSDNTLKTLYLQCLESFRLPFSAPLRGKCFSPHFVPCCAVASLRTRIRLAFRLLRKP